MNMNMNMSVEDILNMKVDDIIFHANNIAETHVNIINRLRELERKELNLLTKKILQERILNFSKNLQQLNEAMISSNITKKNYLLDIKGIVEVLPEEQTGGAKNKQTKKFGPKTKQGKASAKVLAKTIKQERKIKATQSKCVPLYKLNNFFNDTYTDIKTPYMKMRENILSKNISSEEKTRNLKILDMLDMLDNTYVSDNVLKTKIKKLYKIANLKKFQSKSKKLFEDYVNIFSKNLLVEQVNIKDVKEVLPKINKKKNISKMTIPKFLIFMMVLLSNVSSATATSTSVPNASNGIDTTTMIYPLTQATNKIYAVQPSIDKVNVAQLANKLSMNEKILSYYAPKSTENMYELDTINVYNELINNLMITLDFVWGQMSETCARIEPTETVLPKNLRRDALKNAKTSLLKQFTENKINEVKESNTELKTLINNCEQNIEQGLIYDSWRDEVNKFPGCKRNFATPRDLKNFKAGPLYVMPFESDEDWAARIAEPEIKDYDMKLNTVLTEMEGELNTKPSVFSSKLALLKDTIFTTTDRSYDYCELSSQYDIELKNLMDEITKEKVKTLKGLSKDDLELYCPRVFKRTNSDIAYSQEQYEVLMVDLNNKLSKSLEKYNSDKTIDNYSEYLTLKLRQDVYKTSQTIINKLKDGKILTNFQTTDEGAELFNEYLNNIDILQNPSKMMDKLIKIYQDKATVSSLELQVKKLNRESKTLEEEPSFFTRMFNTLDSLIYNTGKIGDVALDSINLLNKISSSLSGQMIMLFVAISLIGGVGASIGVGRVVRYSIGTVGNLLYLPYRATSKLANKAAIQEELEEPVLLPQIEEVVEAPVAAPVAALTAPVEEPVAVPVAALAAPVAAEPTPVAAEPTPVAAEPTPVAAPVAEEPTPVAAPVVEQVTDNNSENNTENNLDESLDYSSSPISSRETSPEPEELFNEKWIRYYTDDGTPYYYNTYTKMTQWNKPRNFIENNTFEQNNSPFQFPPAPALPRRQISVDAANLRRGLNTLLKTKKYKSKRGGKSNKKTKKSRK